MPDEFDVIIIGTGAGGGTLAHTLRSSGKRVLLLERGHFLPREMENWSPDDVFVDGKYISKDTWYDSDGKAFQPQVHYFVGGATKLYGAALYRLRPEDFGEIRHVDGISPAWPVGYDEFEPWYTGPKSSTRCTARTARIRPKGTFSRRIPRRAVSHEPRLQEISDASGGQGLPPVLSAVRHPARRGRPQRGVTASAARGATAIPCLVHAKADAEVMAVRPSLESPNVVLLTDAMASRLATDPTGRTVNGVVVERGE